MHATVNTDIKTKVHFFFISNPPLKKLLFQLLIKTLSKRSFASVILLFAIIKKTKFIIVSTVITLLVVMLMLYLNELLINSSKPQGYLVKTVKSPDKVYRLNSYRYMSNNKWSTVVFLYNNETLNAYKIYTSSEKDTNISWLNNKKIKINDTELKNYYYKK